MILIKKIGPFCFLWCGIFFFNPLNAMDSSEEENTASLSIEIFDISSDEEILANKPIKLDLTGVDSENFSSSQDSLDHIPQKSLKRRRNDSPSTPSYESNQDSERSASYESEEEDSFVVDGHYGSDEENSLETEHSYSYSNNDESTSSSNEYEPKKKYSKTNNETFQPRHSKRLLPSPKSKLRLSSSSSSSEQESEHEPDEEVTPEFMDEIVIIGLQVKLLSNVYLGNVSEKANIFLPRYKAEFELPDGTIETQQGWFKTEKDEICVFASGGLHHIWEKNVRHVNGIFFQKEKQIKIIRAHWIQKHIYKNKHETTIKEDFVGKKQKELHSEYYYNLFFREYFMPRLKRQIKESSGTLKSLTIDAFSWWEVCNTCEMTLSGHKKLLGKDVSLIYKVAARKPYNIEYPIDSCVENKIIPYQAEQKAWKDLWDCISRYTEKKFKNSKEKKEFWTKTYEGLEVCKWFGQAFSEREIDLEGRKTKDEKGSILTIYKAQQPHKLAALENLLSYLRDTNWDLSCWYKGPRFVDKVQPKWKRHWDQVCVPHFGWEEVHNVEKKKDENDKRKGRKPHQERQKIAFEDNEAWEGDCEMCGYEGIENVYRIFHRKYHGSEKFLKLSKEKQKEQEGSKGFTYETPIAQLPAHFQTKRYQSICVGSECVKVLLLKKPDIEEWRATNNDEDTDAKTQEQAKRRRQDDKITKAEKELKKKSKK